MNQHSIEKTCSIYVIGTGYWLGSAMNSLVCKVSSTRTVKPTSGMGEGYWGRGPGWGPAKYSTGGNDVQPGSPQAFALKAA